MSVGRRVRDVDWDAKTSGSALFTADLPSEGAVYAALVRSPHSSARILSIDTAAAFAMPGVLAIATAADLPEGARYVHLGGDRADRSPFAVDFVHYVGQEVAAVAAETPELAVAAAAAVRVSYRKRKAPTNLADARRHGSAVVRPDRAAKGNVSVSLSKTWGDVEATRAGTLSTVEAEGTFTYPEVAHACMETNTTRARWDPRARILELWTSTQAPYFIQTEVAHVLGLPAESVICREIFVGGGFGSKSKISEHEVAVAALALKLPGTPVTLRLSREEEFSFTKSRHRFESTIRLGADHRGHINVIEGDFVVDNGAFNHTGPSVMAAGASTVAEIYCPEAAAYRAQLVYTSKQPGGQFRGYGTPQVAFGLECLVDEIAERVGLDPLELRILNANQPGTVTLSGMRLQSARLVECLTAVREQLRWDERRQSLPDGHGLGVAVAIHGSGSYAYEGSNRSSARVEIDTEGHLSVFFGGADPGTGQKTVIAQVVAHEFGCDPTAVRVTMTDGELTPFDMGSWSSRGTFFSAHAVGQAARSLRGILEEAARVRFSGQCREIRDGIAYGVEESVPLAVLVAAHPKAQSGVLAVEEMYLEERMERSGGAGPHNKSATYSFAAHGVEVAVDRRTGEVRIVDYVAAHDIGRAINPIAAESQICGGVAMGLGAALGERIIYEQGRVVNPRYLNYPLPRSGDGVEARPVLIEGEDAAGPYSAKGLGEITVVPCAPAVSNAIYHAVGVRLRDLPMSPDKVLAALAGDGALRHQVKIRRRPRTWWVEGMRRSYPHGVHHVLHHFGTRFGREATPSRVEMVDSPDTLPQALEAISSGGIPLGGGTDIIADRVRTSDTSVRLVNLSNVPDLREITEVAGGGLRIGATVSLAELEDSGLVPAALREAAAGIAGPQIREAATVAGNLLQDNRCWFYRNGFMCFKRGGSTCPCYAVTGDHSKYHAAVGGHRCQAVTPSDLATVLVALDATALVRRDGGELEEVPLRRFYTGPGETVVNRGDLLVAITISEQSRSRPSAFEKVNGYTGDFAMVSVAVVADVTEAGAVSRPSLVFGAISPTPWLVPYSEKSVALSPAEVTREVARQLVAVAHPLPDNGWKLDAAAGLLDRTLERLIASRLPSPTRD